MHQVTCVESQGRKSVTLQAPEKEGIPGISKSQSVTGIRAYFRDSRGKVPAFALSEPGAESDAASIETRAQLHCDHCVIHGRKTWTSNSGLADVYVVFARTGEAPGTNGITAFLVDGRFPGITLEERLAVLTPHTVGTLHFDNVRVPADRLLGQPGRGFEIAKAVLEIFRPTVGAATLGFARRALDEAIARSMEWVAFKKPICEHQLIQAKLAVKVDASALLREHGSDKGTSAACDVNLGAIVDGP